LEIGNEFTLPPLASNDLFERTSIVSAQLLPFQLHETGCARR